MRLLRKWMLQARAAWLQAQIDHAHDLLRDHHHRLAACMDELAAIRVQQRSALRLGRFLHRIR